MRSDRAALTQAVLEGVAFAFRDSLEALRAAGTELARVTAIGGGSRSRYWLKSIATALGIPVDLPADGDFGAAFGAARLGLIAAEKRRSARGLHRARRPPRPSSPIARSPTPMREAYQRYRALYPAIKGVTSMTTGFFGDIRPDQVRRAGLDQSARLPLLQHGRGGAGKRMEDHLRFAVAYWHSFAWPGGDPFGGQTFERPWFGDTMEHAKLKADVAFEMFSLLGVPYFCFHDADVRPGRQDFRRERHAARRDRRLFRRQA